MGRFLNMVCGVTVFTAASIVCIAGAVADQKDARLPDLFTRLHDSTESGTARAIELIIWKIWNESGASEINALLQEGEAAMALGDYATAKAKFDLVIEARPDFAEAWNKRATVFYLAGAYRESLADIEQVLELEPRHFGALSGLGLVNLALERETAAIDAFERVLSLYPTNDAARQNIEFIEKKMRENDI